MQVKKGREPKKGGMVQNGWKAEKGLEAGGGREAKKTVRGFVVEGQLPKSWRGWEVEEVWETEKEWEAKKEQERDRRVLQVLFS